jgi:hypothetical protein
MLTFTEILDRDGFVTGWAIAINGRTICSLRRTFWDIGTDREEMVRFANSLY